jgi:hypothetical protein
MKVSEKLFEYTNEPFMFLEGGTGLDEEEDYIYKRLVNNNFDSYKLDDLYNHPKKLASIHFLKPKTIIFGTTGVYEDKINMLVSLLDDLDLSSIEKVVLTIDSEREIPKILRHFKNKYPKLKFYKFEYFFTDENEVIKIKQIEI